MTRKKLLVTGAAGGMGRAVTRLLGASRDLVLNDVAAEGLETFAAELRGDGFTVSAHAGSLTDDGILAKLAGELAGGAPFDIVHTAGVSPSMADWRTIMDVNWVGTELLLRAVEPLLVPGTAAVLIASNGGYVVPAIPEIDAVMGDPLAGDFFEKFGVIVEQMAAHAGPAGVPGIAYAFSKRAVLRTAEARAAAWGAKGARIVTISPGIILTPMGRLEAGTEQVAEIVRSSPLGHAATPMDIAFGARFLLSEEASFITGTDLTIDGGTVGANKGPFG